MITGLISPIPHLKEFASGDFHLILSHLLEHKEYRDHYTAVNGRGAWTILDNSAHEFGEGGAEADLLSQAIQVRAREVVVPDVLFKDVETFERGKAAMDFFKKNEVHLDTHNIQLMVVPQAETIYRWASCLTNLVTYHARLFPGRKLGIGISKDYEMWTGGLGNLLAKYVQPLTYRYNLEIHMLGWGRRLYDLSSFAVRFPWLRSTDSAKPFVYALEGIELDLSREVPEYPTRPENYFFAELNEGQLQIARQNVQVFQARAGKVRHGSVIPTYQAGR